MTSAGLPPLAKQSPIAGLINAHPRVNVDTQAIFAGETVLLDRSCLPRASLTGAERDLDALAPIFGQALRVATGELHVRIAPGEVLVLGRWMADSIEDFDLPRTPGFDHGYWFYLIGDLSSDILPEACQIDLRPRVFAPFMAVRTRLFSTNCTLIREDYAGRPAYHLLGCQSFARHVFEKLAEVSERLGRFSAQPVSAGLPMPVSDRTRLPT